MKERVKITGTLFLIVLSSLLVLAQEPYPEMVFIRGGKFRMGSNLGVKDEQPVHDVVLDDFYIGKYEITQEQWKWPKHKIIIR
jgi:formylglycine-generating enzyme